MKKNIFITGSSGLLGGYLKNYLKKKKIKFKIFKRNKYKNYNKIYFCKFFKRNNYTHIINLAAYTDVDACEKNKSVSKRINVSFLKKICDGIKMSNLNIKLIHFSTDQMYYNLNQNNEKNLKIRNYYTACKIMSEKISLSVDSIILRTNFFGKSLVKKRISFTDWIYNSIKNKKKIYLADDIFFSPIWINSLIKLIFKFINSNKKGIFNVGSNNGISKYEFGCAFVKEIGQTYKLKYIVKAKKRDLNFFAKRNKDMRMNLKKFEKNFYFKLPNLKNEIKKCAKSYF